MWINILRFSSQCDFVSALICVICGYELSKLFIFLKISARIERIFTDPCASASSAQSVFYRTIFLLTDDTW
jgi:hypothetical protein